MLRHQRLLWSCLVCLLVYCIGIPTEIAFPQTCFIDHARQLPNGAEVSVSGQVTVPSGKLGSANLDVGFAIQDASGGIYVTTDEDLALELGDLVSVSGRLQDDGHNQRMLQLRSWQLSQRRSQPIVPQLSTAKLAGKFLDGRLVTVRGQIIKSLQDDAPYGDRLWIRDDTGDIQIYLAKSTAINPQELPFLEIGQLIQVTGLSSQFDDHDEVMPRSRADLVPLAKF
ncbi:MAG: hypothetical protein ACFBSG_19000 [Leptolyngbyaceae cyanobacterium]